jgi:hypothetical protein
MAMGHSKRYCPQALRLFEGENMLLSEVRVEEVPYFKVQAAHINLRRGLKYPHCADSLL